MTPPTPASAATTSMGERTSLDMEQRSSAGGYRRCGGGRPVTDVEIQSVGDQHDERQQGNDAGDEEAVGKGKTIGLARHLGAKQGQPLAVQQRLITDHLAVGAGKLADTL